MSKERVRTVPNLSTNSPLHQQAMAAGDEHFRTEAANVADHFKGQSVEDIRLALQISAHPFAVCFEHWTGDFNLSTGIRNANGFNAREVFYVGDKRWDRRGAVGVHNYTPVTFLSTIDDLVALKDTYIFVGVDNVPGSVPIENYQWSLPCLLIFGEEGTGLTPSMQSLCKDIVHISQFGSVRSLNCGTASGIAMYDLVSKLNKSSFLF